jgi:hypothetical protein
MQFWRPMSIFALVAWVITVFAGLFLLAIWLIEYDPEIQRAAATRLPIPVISSHAALALLGLIVWVSYLITGEDQFAYATLAILAGVVGLGVTMAVRWVKVYRSTGAPPKRSVQTLATASGRAGGMGAGGSSVFDASPRARDEFQAPTSPDLLVPPERHFPLPVVIGHGLFAITTVVLVLLTVIGLGGS